MFSSNDRFFTKLIKLPNLNDERLIGLIVWSDTNGLVIADEAEWERLVTERQIELQS